MMHAASDRTGGRTWWRAVMALLLMAAMLAGGPPSHAEVEGDSEGEAELSGGGDADAAEGDCGRRRHRVDGEQDILGPWDPPP